LKTIGKMHYTNALAFVKILKLQHLKKVNIIFETYVVAFHECNENAIVY